MILFIVSTNLFGRSDPFDFFLRDDLDIGARRRSRPARLARLGVVVVDARIVCFVLDPDLFGGGDWLHCKFEATSKIFQMKLFVWS